MSMFQWSSRANIALVEPTYNTTGSGSISDCLFCGSYKIDRMKMESYSSFAGLSRLRDIADPRDHHLPDPQDALWPDSIAPSTQNLTQAFYIISWLETAHQPGKGKRFPAEDQIFSRWPILQIQRYCKGFAFKPKNCLCTSLKSKLVSGRSGIMEALIAEQCHRFALHTFRWEWLWLWRMARVMV